MRRSVARAHRWRDTIGCMLLVVGIWTYYLFSDRGIQTIEIKEKDIDIFDKGRQEGNNLYELIPTITRDQNASQSSKKTDPQKVVIITSQSKSGSSLTGQVLAASSSTMYFHEPLLPFGMDCAAAVAERKIALLSRILSCDFNNLQQEYNSAFKQSLVRDAGDCASKGFCRPDASLLKGYTAICNWVYFRKTSVADFDPKSLSCGFPLKERILSEQCLNSKIVSTEVTRACSINDLQKAYDSLTAETREVYVIDLVRDPR